MSSRAHQNVALAALGGAAGALAATLLYLRQRRFGARKDAPVLCFGDSLTCGYHGVWVHPSYSPKTNPDDPARETEAVRLKPYAIRLDEKLAAQAGSQSPQRDLFAVHRGYSGWTAEQLLPALRRELRAGPWRCAVVFAGSNDVVFGEAAEAALDRIRALWRACDDARIPVVVVPNPPADLRYHGWVTAGGTAEGLARAEARKGAMVALGALVRAAAAAEGRPAVPILVQDEAHARHWDDCLHLSPAGSDHLGELVFDAIARSGL